MARKQAFTAALFAGLIALPTAFDSPQQGLGQPAPAADPVTLAALASRIDPYVAKPRVIVLTDIANEPDDQMSFVRLLVSSNQFDIEGLVATTSRHLRSSPRPDVLLTVLSAYANVRPNLLKHEPGFPSAEALGKLVMSGQETYGLAGDTADYHSATWTGMAGDEFYRNGPGADFTTVSEAW